jgi:alkylation response protein AidB-like acyl-CoA dehydrogenase
MVVVPSSAAEIQDDWTTCGLQGTGSNSIVLDCVFVPEWMSWNPALPPPRGGAGTRMGIGGNFAPETAGFALGVGRRAFAEIVSSATVRKRGGKGVVLADRGAFLLEFGRRRMQYESVQALAESELTSTWEIAQSVGYLPEEYQNRLRAVASYCVESVLDAVRVLWPFLGASELQTERALQRCLRDLIAMTQHYHVSNVNFETFAATMLQSAAR